MNSFSGAGQLAETLLDFVDIYGRGVISSRCSVRDECGIAGQEALLAAVEQSPDSVVITDAAGTILLMNPAFTAMTGYTREQSLGQNLCILRSVLQPRTSYDEVWNILRSGRPWQARLNNRRKDGTVHEADMRIVPVRAPDGLIVSYVATTRDVPQELADEEAHRFLAAIVEGSDDAIIASTPAGIVLTSNRGAEVLLGYTAGEMIGKHVDTFVPPGPSSRMADGGEQVSQGGNLSRYDGVCLHKDGRKILVNVTASPVRDSAGEVVAISAILRDITQRQATEHARAFLGSIVESSDDAIYAKKLDGTIISWNRGAEVLFGYTGQEILGKNIAILTPLDRREEVRQHLATIRHGGTIRPFETVLQGKNGCGVDVLLSVAPIRNPAGEVVGASGIAHDIRKRVQAERKLRDSEERFRILADGCPAMIWVTNAEGGVQFFNRAYKEFSGRTFEQGYGDGWRRLLHPEDAKEYIQALNLAVRNHTTLRAEARIRRADGEWRWIASFAEPRFAPGGEFLGHVGLSPDITERKQTEHAVRLSEARLRGITDSAQDAILMMDARGAISYWNPAAESILGYRSEEAVGKDLHTLIAPERFHPAQRAAFPWFLRTGNGPAVGTTLELAARKKDGREIAVDLSLSSIRLNGEWQAIGIIRDITERKQYEDALRSSEEKFRQLADNIGEVFWMMDAAGSEILYVSPAYEQIWGRSCRSLYQNAMEWMDAIHPGDRKRAQEAFEKQLRGDDVVSEYRISTPSGQEKWIRDRAFPVRDQDGHLIRVAGVAEDFTQRKQAENDHARLIRSIEQVAESIVITDLNGSILYVNPAFEKLTGYSREEAIGQNPRVLKSGHHPTSYYQKMWATLLEGKTWCGELINRRKDGTLFQEDATISPIKDKGGNVINYVAVKRDITSRKHVEAELAQAKNKAEAANRAKSEFLANMSHEIRTPMNGVIGMTGLLLDTELNEEQRRYAEIVHDSGESLLRLVNDILDFSKIEAGKLEFESLDFELESLLDDLAADLSVRAREKGLQFCCAVDSSVPRLLRGDPGRLRQILTNLITNAIKFTTAGEVAVRASLETENAAEVLLRFTVQDTGIGIPEDKLGIIFTKFTQVDASTTRKYGGSGLGLAISKQLAELMGGKIGVVSREGKGSEFWFTVRLGKQPEVAQNAAPPLAHPCENSSPEPRRPFAGRRHRILVAEDNSTNQVVALGILKNLGLYADAVADGAEVIRVLESIPYDLVLMDVQMPVMDGVASTRQIRSPASAVLNHWIPIIAMTAHALQGDRERFLEAGMNDYVSKPVSPAALIDVLKCWLPKENNEQETSKEVALHSALPVVFDRVGMLDRLMHDEDLAQKLLEVFLEDAPSQIEQLRYCLGRSDAIGVQRQVHSIKGAAACVGGEALRTLTREMEQAAKAGDLNSVVARMPELDRHFLDLREAIVKHRVGVRQTQAGNS